MICRLTHDIVSVNTTSISQWHLIVLLGDPVLIGRPNYLLSNERLMLRPV